VAKAAVYKRIIKSGKVSEREERDFRRLETEIILKPKTVDCQINKDLLKQGNK
jgi:hypothetical protein